MSRQEGCMSTTTGIERWMCVLIAQRIRWPSADMVIDWWLDVLVLDVMSEKAKEKLENREEDLYAQIDYK